MTSRLATRKNQTLHHQIVVVIVHCLCQSIAIAQNASVVMGRASILDLVKLPSQIAAFVLGSSLPLFLNEGRGIAQPGLIGLGQAEILGGHRFVAHVIRAHFR